MSLKEINPVGYLQEFAMKSKKAFPDYIDCGSTGQDHNKVFSCKCVFDENETTATAQQKKIAKIESAKAMITLLKEQNYFECGNISPSKTNGCASPPNIADGKNPISNVNEYCQRNGFNATFIETSTGPANFLCECQVKEFKTYGHGPSKKVAKCDAATKMWLSLSLVSSSCELSDDAVEIQKNPISLLQELSAKNSFPTPEYYEMPAINRLFVIKCTVGRVSCEGTSTTKKGAKFMAASKVLKQLLEPTSGPSQSVITTSSPPATSIVTTSSLPTTSIVTKESPSAVIEQLPEFIVDASSEEEDNVTDKGDVSSEFDSTLNAKLENLNLYTKQKYDQDKADTSGPNDGKA